MSLRDPPEFCKICRLGQDEFVKIATEPVVRLFCINRLKKKGSDNKSGIAHETPINSASMKHQGPSDVTELFAEWP
ncbi:MAG: hypothetical protein KDA80_15985, partial [Planctomycetaceae bacterium]|nr:hypothetical protein [Planctomycetaceae bacterium]